MTSDLAAAPPPGTPVPKALLDYAAGRALTLVWQNEIGGITAWVRDPRGDVFAKWQPTNAEITLAIEAERMEWLAARHPAPKVLHYAALDGGELMVTEAIPAASAVDKHWVARPEQAVAAIAEGLRALHSLPTADCPFDWSVPTRLVAAGRRGITVPAELHEAPSIDQLAVCHGDACAPNTLVAADGRFAATVDVGMLGLADRWADLAVASMSLGWNYGPGWDDHFFASYGITPDRERIDYYRALWNAS